MPKQPPKGRKTAQRPNLAQIRAGDFTLRNIAAHDDWSDDEVAALEAQGVFGAYTDEDRKALEAWLAAVPRFLNTEQWRIAGSPAVLDRPPDHTLSDSERAKLEDLFDDDKVSFAVRRVAGLLLSSWGYDDITLGKRRLIPKPAPISAHGNRYTEDQLLDIVRQSGAKSKTEYDRWRKSNPKAPPYKTFYKRFRGKTKPGERPWRAARRLAGL